MLLRTTTGWKLSGTETFRLASAKLFGSYGGNLQNIPDRIRRIYVPDDGKEFVQVDQSGAEALIVAYLCRKGKFRELFLNNIKSHVYVALHLFRDYWQESLNEDISPFLRNEIKEIKTLPRWKELEGKIKKHDKYYAIGKMVCHASNYGMRGPTFAGNVLERSEGKIRLSAREATQFLNVYHTLFPEISDWQSEVKQTIYKTRYLRNLFGYPRYFGGAFTDKLFMEANAFVPQSTVGTITNLAYVEIQDWIDHNPDANYDLLVNCHDSILLQCPCGEGNYAANLIRNSIERDLVSLKGECFRMKSETVVGMNWGKYNELTNPEGLREI